MKQLHAVTRFQIGKQLTPSVQPFHALVYPLPLDLITDISKSYGDRCVASIAAEIHNFTPEKIERSPGERIRVGYVSSDFVNHPLAHLMQSTFGMHDRSRFEVICFSLSKNDESEYFKKISSEVPPPASLFLLVVYPYCRLKDSLMCRKCPPLTSQDSSTRCACMSSSTSMATQRELETRSSPSNHLLFRSARHLILRRS